jgi:uncharacterized protein
MLRSIALTVACSILAAGGACIPVPPTDNLSKQQVYQTLDSLILDPGVSCEQLRDGFNVEHLEIVYSPLALGLDYEEHYVKAFDGTPLRIWYIPAALDRGTVILSGGAAGSMPCYLFTAELLIRNGWTVVMYDYRGFGGSAGQASLAYLTPDLDALVDWTLTRTGREAITLMGISLGTISSVAVSTLRPNVANGVILDSPVALGLEITRFSLLLGEELQLYLDYLDPLLITENVIESMATPMLILLNERDLLTPPVQAELLYERAAGPKELARFPGAGHARGVFRDTEYYSFRVETFLSDIWGQLTPLTIVGEN